MPDRDRTCRRTRPLLSFRRVRSIDRVVPFHAPAGAGLSTVLVVDDEPEVCAAVADTLHRRGLTVLTASGAADALQILAREAVHVVVSDERMPLMGGTAFLGEVRRRHPRVVRMVLSGSADPQAISKAVNDAGVFRYLLKPCTPADMVLAVEQALAAHAAQQIHPDDEDGDRAGVSVDETLAHLRLALQPIYTSCDGALFAHEALLRVPDSLCAGPEALLRAARHEGRVWDVDRAVRACIAGRVPYRPEGTALFVNLHPQSLLDPQLYSRRDPLAPHARHVVFELTERASLTGVDDMTGRLARLREMGYRVAIDDMGAGYSGLNALTAVLPDFVKFDRELIRLMHAVPAKRKIVGSMVTVCRELGIRTVAEGIERREEWEAVRDLGCNCMQGYLLGRPGDSFCRDPLRSC
jgi:EAL domain-containing protein (putative c-di-GMP-specific phosphodiesterase class I)